MKSMNKIFCAILCTWLPMTMLQAQSSHWDWDPHAYEFDMTAYVVLTVGNEAVEDYERYEVAAFCDDECRGIAELIDIAGTTVGYMRIRSNEATGEVITFKGYDTQLGRELLIPETSTAFQANGMYGKPSIPVVLPAYDPQSEVRLNLSETSITVRYGEDVASPAVVTNGYGAISYESRNPSIAQVDASTGEVCVKAVGTTEVLAKMAATEIYDAASASYQLTVLPPEGQSEAASDANPVQITIPEGKTMATFCCPMPIDFSGATDDCRAYIVSGIDGSTVEFEEVTETKGGVGLLMYGKSGTYTFPVRTSFNEPENELIGTLAPTYIERETDGRINLGLKGTKFVPINAGVLPANKAYLSTALQAGVKELSIVFRGADGISTTIQAESVQEWFDITGKKVNRPINKGIYINRGQKIIIK